MSFFSSSPPAQPASTSSVTTRALDEQKENPKKKAKKLLALALPSGVALLGSNRTNKSLLPGDGKTFTATMPPKIRTNTSDQLIDIKQSYYTIAQCTSSSSIATFTGMLFTASLLDQFSSLVAVFDQYRIIEVEVWFHPRVEPTSSTSNSMGLFCTVVDFDDANTLTTVPQALDYTNAMQTSGSVGHYRRFKPHAAVAAYTGSFNGYCNVESPWIDAASGTVQHYGVKTAWTITDTPYIYDVTVRLHTQWRNVR